MPAGIVKAFYRSRGYGFIRAENDSRDVFVHRTALETANLTELRKGQKVTFDVADDQGRSVAKNLRLVEERTGRGYPIMAGPEGELERESVRKKSGNSNRKPITRATLERCLTDDVRKAAPECEGFVGVIIQAVTPEVADGINWVVKGVKYGKADRSRCETVLGTVLREKQQNYVLVDDRAGFKEQL
jgi:cold shock CspA family protein